MTTTTTDEELIQQAEALYKEERLLEAARLLQQVQDTSKLTDLHQRILQNANICNKAVAELLSTPDESHGWKKQGESHGRYHSSIFYKVAESGGAKMTCRMETPIPTSLLVPLLAVLNESSLYKTWIPYWSTPMKIGVRESNQLIQDTKGHQIIQIHADVPWPMQSREVLMDALAVDDIEQQGFIIAKMRTLYDTPEGNKLLPEGFSLPPVDPNLERIDFDGAVLVRACPKNYRGYSDKEQMLLVQFMCSFDAHMDLIPISMINFVTRTVIGRVWAMLLQVAEQVRDGTRIEHKQIIEQKQEFYQWVEQRTQYMLGKLEQQQEKTTDATTATASSVLQVPQEEWTLPEVLALSS